MKLKRFLKQETVLSVAAVLAVLSMFFVPPDADYLGYIDLRTLAILFSLMTIMAGLRRQGVFDRMGRALLARTGSTLQLVLVLVGLCFFGSMIITNDVSLLTFVPFTFVVLSGLAPDTRRALMTFCVIGGGPTGVEMTGIIAELAQRRAQESRISSLYEWQGVTEVGNGASGVLGRCVTDAFSVAGGRTSLPERAGGVRSDPNAGASAGGDGAGANSGGGMTRLTATLGSRSVTIVIFPSADGTEPMAVIDRISGNGCGG